MKFHKTDYSTFSLVLLYVASVQPLPTPNPPSPPKKSEIRGLEVENGYTQAMPLKAFLLV